MIVTIFTIIFFPLIVFFEKLTIASRNVNSNLLFITIEVLPKLEASVKILKYPNFPINLKLFAI